ncbi:hypothetical protein HAX54_017123, partial [Datura stramonium]|nr:hypothetical protein [Datura stramonium]
MAIGGCRFHRRSSDSKRCAAQWRRRSKLIEVVVSVDCSSRGYERLGFGGNGDKYGKQRPEKGNQLTLEFLAAASTGLAAVVVSPQQRSRHSGKVTAVAARSNNAIIARPDARLGQEPLTQDKH